MAQTATLILISASFSLGTVGTYQRVLSDFDIQMRVDLQEAYFPSRDFFCEPITIEHSAPYSASESYSAYFEDPSRDVSPNSQIRVNELHPMVELDSFSLAQYPKTDDVFVIRGVRYTIDFLDDDGTGVIRVYLLREGKQV